MTNEEFAVQFTKLWETAKAAMDWDEDASEDTARWWEIEDLCRRGADIKHFEVAVNLVKGFGSPQLFRVFLTELVENKAYYHIRRCAEEKFTADDPAITLVFLACVTANDDHIAKARASTSAMRDSLGWEKFIRLRGDLTRVSRMRHTTVKPRPFLGNMGRWANDILTNKRRNLVKLLCQLETNENLSDRRLLAVAMSDLEAVLQYYPRPHEALALIRIWVNDGALQEELITYLP